MDLKFGGRSRDIEEVSPLSHKGSRAEDLIHEFDVLYYTNLFLPSESPFSPKSGLGEFNLDGDNEPILFLLCLLFPAVQHSRTLQELLGWA